MKGIEPFCNHYGQVGLSPGELIPKRPDVLAIDREEVLSLLQQAKVIHVRLKIITKIGKDLNLQSLAR